MPLADCHGHKSFQVCSFQSCVCWLNATGHCRLRVPEMKVPYSESESFLSYLRTWMFSNVQSKLSRTVQAQPRILPGMISKFRFSICHWQTATVTKVQQVTSLCSPVSTLKVNWALEVCIYYDAHFAHSVSRVLELGPSGQHWSSRRTIRRSLLRCCLWRSRSSDHRYCNHRLPRRTIPGVPVAREATDDCGRCTVETASEDRSGRCNWGPFRALQLKTVPGVNAATEDHSWCCNQFITWYSIKKKNSSRGPQCVICKGVSWLAKFLYTSHTEVDLSSRRLKPQPKPLKLSSCAWSMYKNPTLLTDPLIRRSHYFPSHQIRGQHLRTHWREFYHWIITYIPWHTNRAHLRHVRGAREGYYICICR